MNDQPKPTDPLDEQAQIDKEVAEALGDLSVMDLLGDASNAPVMPGAASASMDEPDLRRGRILAIHDDDVFVDVGGKSQGIISITQFETKPKIGEILEFVIEGLLGDEGLLKLSRRGAVEKATWDSLERGKIVEARVTGCNTGGLELKLAGQRAFMPASQIDIHHVENISDFLNQKLKCQIVELDRRKKNIVLSRRAVLEVDMAQQREELLKELAVDQVREGVVRNVQKFGAFVDIGGMDGLLHVSDMSYSHINDPGDVVKVGDKVSVKVLKIEDGGKRISLGLKQVGPDPWTLAGDKYVPGVQTSGKVTKLASFGVFVELESGIEGLIPMGELSWSRVNNADEVVKVGQEIVANVISCEPERHRISLSIKQLQNDPWEDVANRFVDDAEVTGQVTRITHFGAFVQIEPGVEGLIHISELSDKRVNTVDDVLKVGQEVKARVLSVDPDSHRISLSIKPESSGSDRKGGPAGGKASRQDMKKYVVRDTKDARSMESLMGKWGDPNKDNLKGGIG